MRHLLAVTLLLGALVLAAACGDSKAAPTPAPSDGAATSALSPEATTERRALTPPAPTSTDVIMVPIPAPTTFRGYPADLLMITTFEGARRPVTDPRDIEAAVPWPIVLPSYLPPGYDRIGLVLVSQPMSGLPPDAAARTTRVMVAFRGSQPGPNFSLTLSGGHVGTDAGEQLDVNGRPAEYHLNQARAHTLAWDVCGRTYMLGALEAQLPKAELIRIAESVPEQCS